MKQKTNEMGLEIVILSVFITLLNLLRLLRGKPIYKGAKHFFTEATVVEIELTALLTIAGAYALFFSSDISKQFWEWYLRACIVPTLLAVGLGIVNTQKHLGQVRTLLTSLILLSALILAVLIIMWSIEFGHETFESSSIKLLICLFSLGSILILSLASHRFSKNRALKWKLSQEPKT